MNNTPTPETDDLAITCYIDSVIEGVLGFRAVPIDDCRKLERERDEAREQNAKLREALEKCREDSICYAEHMRRCGYVAAYKESTENADIATTILNKLKECAK